MPYVLPQEIIDQVIDQVHNNSPRTLKACSLICRSWTNRSQTHLHHTISIRDSPSGASLAPITLDRYSTPHVADMVRHVDVSLRYPIPQNEYIFLGIWEVISRLRNVRVLSFAGIDWEYAQLDKDQFKDIFRGVTSLELRSCRCELPENFFSFISNFPNLTELSLSDTQWKGEGPFNWAPSKSCVYIPGQRIRKITVDGEDEESLDFLRSISRWLSILSKVTTHDFTLDWRAEYPAEAFSLFLRSLGDSLGRLMINVINETSLDLSKSCSRTHAFML